MLTASYRTLLFVTKVAFFWARLLAPFSALFTTYTKKRDLSYLIALSLGSENKEDVLRRTVTKKRARIESGPLPPALLRIGRDSVELREGTDPPGNAGLFGKLSVISS
jgi:hypothetical protein